jgi:hypothetical protein
LRWHEIEIALSERKSVDVIDASNSVVDERPPRQESFRVVANCDKGKRAEARREMGQVAAAFKLQSRSRAFFHRTKEDFHDRHAIRSKIGILAQAAPEALDFNDSLTNLLSILFGTPTASESELIGGRKLGCKYIIRHEASARVSFGFNIYLTENLVSRFNRAEI